MQLKDFRSIHSKLIEQYQLIEYHLEGIFGIAGNGDFEELTHRVENDTMGELIRKVRFIVKEKKYDFLSKEDFAILDEIRDARNYWCHQCYLDIKDKNFDKIGSLNDDLKKTSDMNQKLRETFTKIKDIK